MLIFKTRSVELYPMTSAFTGALPKGDTITSPELPRLVHRFSSTTFRDISSSDFLPAHGDGSEDVRSLKFCFLADDVLQGVFQYLVHIRFPATSHPAPPASLDVECIGVYAMANNINIAAVRPLKGNTGLASPLLATSAFSPAPSPLPTPSPTPSKHNAPNQTRGHGIPNPSSRGFVSTIALGPQGKRAVWVERKRGSTMREVFVWATSQGFEDGDIMDQNLTMDGKVVYTVGSYDLRGNEGESTSIRALSANDVFPRGPDTLCYW